MSWLKKLIPKIRTSTPKKKAVPEGLWAKCEGCGAVLFRVELERSLEVCPKCTYHHPIAVRKRLNEFLDPDSWLEIADDIEGEDRLKFRDSKKYSDRLHAAQEKTGNKEALIVYQGKLETLPVVCAAFDFGFMGGSMGSAVGDRFVQAVNTAIQLHCPLICFSASGGARMQEGLISLMQMAKVSTALVKLSEHHLPYISVLTDPTMGGVAASLAMLGDIIIAEPNALIGFAGPRVIEQTVRATLPEGFQRSEFLLKHGATDLILDRRELRKKIASILRKLTDHVAHA